MYASMFVGICVYVERRAHVALERKAHVQHMSSSTVTITITVTLTVTITCVYTITLIIWRKVRKSGLKIKLTIKDLKADLLEFAQDLRLCLPICRCFAGDGLSCLEVDRN